MTKQTMETFTILCDECKSTNTKIKILHSVETVKVFFQCFDCENIDGTVWKNENIRKD